jgi:hypothetical protein
MKSLTICANPSGIITSQGTHYGLNIKYKVHIFGFVGMLYIFTSLKLCETLYGARIFKLLRSPRIYSKEPIPQGYVAWRVGMTTPFRSRLLAPKDCLKIPALDMARKGGGGMRIQVIVGKFLVSPEDVV